VADFENLCASWVLADNVAFLSAFVFEHCWVWQQLVYTCIVIFSCYFLFLQNCPSNIIEKMPMQTNNNKISCDLVMSQVQIFNTDANYSCYSINIHTL